MARHEKGKILISTSKGDRDWGVYLRSHIRRLFYKSPLRNQALKRNRLTGHIDLMFCDYCDRDFRKDELQIDHDQPVVPVEGWDSWDGYIRRMFCDPEKDLSVLCKPCHKEKTNKENATRRITRKSTKGKTTRKSKTKKIQ